MQLFNKYCSSDDTCCCAYQQILKEPILQIGIVEFDIKYSDTLKMR